MFDDFQFNNNRQENLKLKTTTHNNLLFAQVSFLELLFSPSRKCYKMLKRAIKAEAKEKIC